MTNYNLINRYEYLSSTPLQSYQLLVDKFKFKQMDSVNLFEAGVTKEGYNILFIDQQQTDMDVEISPTRDQIIIKQKNIHIPQNIKPTILLIKYKMEKRYKFYGLYTQQTYSTNKIKYIDYNPTYYLNQKN